jgi:mannosyl-3-phosphoglycerate phosphatase
MDNLNLSLIIVSDVDGCLLDGDTYAPGAAVEALQVLSDHDVPLILCSSKTAGELRLLQRRLGIEHPFICENGAALHVPSDYFPFEIPGSVHANGYEIVRFAGPHDEVVSALRRAAHAASTELQLFADMTASSIAGDTGLTRHEAELAKAREHDEPFRMRAPGSFERGRLVELLATEGVQVFRGGRYDHAVMNADKGRAVMALRRLYRRAYGPLTTMGLGDALNDVPLLRCVDVPVVVRSGSEALTREVHERVPWAEVTDAVGPAGWHATVVKAVYERVRLWEGPQGDTVCHPTG